MHITGEQNISLKIQLSLSFSFYHTFSTNIFSLYNTNFQVIFSYFPYRNLELQNPNTGRKLNIPYLSTSLKMSCFKHFYWYQNICLNSMRFSKQHLAERENGKNAIYSITWKTIRRLQFLLSNLESLLDSQIHQPIFLITQYNILKNKEYFAELGTKQQTNYHGVQ